MIYIYKDRKVRIEWTIFKGQSPVREDFTRALVKAFIVGNRNRFPVMADTCHGTLFMDLPEGLTEGVYDLEVVYVKNMGNLHNCHYNDRCFMRSRIDAAFAITDYQSEETYPGDDEVTLPVKSRVASYGYDGLSAYEIAVLRGDWAGTEEDWVNSRLGVSLLDGTGQSEKGAMTQKAVTDELEKLQTQITIINEGGMRITMSLSPNIIYKGEPQTITVKAVFAGGLADELSIRSADGETIVKKTNVQSVEAKVSREDEDTFTARAVISKLSVEESVKLNAVYPFYAGSGTVYTDVVNDEHRLSMKTGIAGTYNIEVETEGDHVFFVLPQEVKINNATMGGFGFPLTLTSGTVNGMPYNIYTSDNVYLKGTITIVLS